MISFVKHSGIYTLTAKQELNLSLERAWDFFSSPENLSKITPPHMGFSITGQVTNRAYAGQIITYKVGILPGIKTNWVTEITQVIPKVFFVDEQRFGPYAMWHHQHWFEEISEGRTRITDQVCYKIPLGILGHLAQWLFVKRQLKGIFEYRCQKLASLFD